MDSNSTDKKKYQREATPEEMAECNRLADGADRYHFGFGLTDDESGQGPGADTEADVSPSIVVDKTREEK